MIKTMEELKKVEMTEGNIINGIDSPNLRSVDSTAPVETPVDELPKDEEREVKGATVPDKKEPPKEEKETENEDDKKETEKEKTVKKEESPVPQSKDAVQKRIDEITKKRRTAERERDYERERRLSAEAELKKLKAVIPPTDKPKREDFEDDEAFIEALTDWKVQAAVKKTSAETADVQKETSEREAIAETEEMVKAMIDKGKDEYEDFAKVALDKDLIISQEMTSIILESDIPEKILYYLGKNPDISAEIAELTPLKVARRISAIEAELSKDSEEESEEKEVVKKAVEKKEVKPKKESNAPEPIKPPKQTGAVDRDPANMTMKEYIAWRKGEKK